MAKPKIRFKGFTGDWEERKLGDVVDYNNGIGHEEYVLPEGKYELVTLKSINSEGKMTCSEKFVNKEFETLQKGTLIMMLSEQAKGMLGMTAIIPCNNKYILNQRVAALTLRDGIDSSFLTKAINRKQYYFEQMGAGTKVQNITKGHVENCIIEIPKYEEQLLIGNYFSSLDHLITLHQQKCEETKTLKKYMLQNMFVQNGQTVPQIRFSGFTEDWEQRKLRDVAFVSTGCPFDSKDFSDDGDFLVITNGNIQDASPVVDDSLGNRISIDDNKIKSAYLLDIGDVLVTMDGTVGRSAKVIINGQILAQRVGRLKAFNSSNFLYQWLNTGAFSKEMSTLSHGGTIKHISLDEIRSYEAMMPQNAEEQRKIGDYLESLDHLSTLHQQKCNTLKNIKKYMLQKMFV